MNDFSVCVLCSDPVCVWPQFVLIRTDLTKLVIFVQMGSRPLYTRRKNLPTTVLLFVLFIRGRFSLVVTLRSSITLRILTSYVCHGKRSGRYRGKCHSRIWCVSSRQGLQYVHFNIPLLILFTFPSLAAAPNEIKERERRIFSLSKSRGRFH